MNRGKHVGWAALVLVLLISGWGGVHLVHASQTRTQSSQVVTLFVHGYGSSAHAEQHMVKAAERAGVTRTVVRADVSTRGKVHLSRKFSKQAKNPIVEVQFAANREPQSTKNATWLHQVIVQLQREDHVQRINFVGHSKGNVDIMTHLLRYGSDPNLPRVEKQVAIAGPFNGVLRMTGSNSPLTKAGVPTQPTATYQRIAQLRRTYPQGIRVLNIYGNVNGTNADGTVGNNSSRAMQSLTVRAKSYRAVMISGWKAQHSRLHANHQVDQLLIHFLWQNRIKEVR